MKKINSIVARNGYSQHQGEIDSSLIIVPVHAWMKPRSREAAGQSILNANQLTSLNAMIAYVASKSDGVEFSIERKLSDRFNIPNVKYLPSEAFDQAIRYLVDSIND